MLSKVSFGAFALSIALLLGFSPAHAGANQENIPLMKGPPIVDIVSPYDGALTCLATVLTDAQKETAFTVGTFVDQTGKTNYVSDSGTGAFSTQGSDTMLYTSLALTGVQVVDGSAQFRQTTDWTLDKFKFNPEFTPGMLFADVTLSGAITTFDINELCTDGTVRIAGIGGDASTCRILVGMDARLIRGVTAISNPNGPGIVAGPDPIGRVVAVTRINKQIVGTQGNGGATTFFGRGGKATLIDIDFGKHQNEAIQYMERVMIDRLVAVLVSKYFATSQCDEWIAYGDTLALPS